jgi:hypothetical protein
MHLYLYDCFKSDNDLIFSPMAQIFDPTLPSPPDIIESQFPPDIIESQL